MMVDIAALTTLAHEYEHNLPELPAQSWLDQRSMAGWVDHTLLRPEGTCEQIDGLCAEARTYEFMSVCVNPIFVSRAARLLEGSPVLVCTVVGFPLGAVPTATKVFETRQAISQGAKEIDMVIPVGLLRSGDVQGVYDDIRGVVEAAHQGGALVKVIHENAYLSRYEKILACLLSMSAGAEFVKTSTGFASTGATVEDVNLMRRVVGIGLGVKAAGGVRTLADARAMLQAGASRLGSSAGAKIMQEIAAESSK